ncbi:MAG: response regulator [Rhodocyclaceae bacterium]|nr:response regulator [Rhodocyclaceae bacterium]
MSAGNILIVEDDAQDVLLTRRVLEKMHLANRVDVIGDGQLALDYLLGTSSHAGNLPPDLPVLLLLDINLPRLSGLEVLSRLRASDRTARLPVVMLTASQDERDLYASYENGCNSYVVKPLDFAEFAAAVSQIGVYWMAINVPPVAARPS